MQVEVLTSQLASLEQQAEAVPMLRRQLHTSNSQHEECEMKLHDMIEENKGIQEQVRVSRVLSYKGELSQQAAESSQDITFTVLVPNCNPLCRLQSSSRRLNEFAQSLPGRASRSKRTGECLNGWRTCNQSSMLPMEDRKR